MNYIINRLKNYRLDKFEKDLVLRKKNYSPYQSSGKKIFFQCVNDHFILHLYSEIIKENQGKKFYGKLEVPIKFSKLDLLLVCPYILKKISQFLIKRKWKKLYRSIGINEFLETSFFSTINFVKSISLFLKIKTIRQLQNLEINGIELGDLLLDTIIRFRSSNIPKVKIKSFDNIFFYYLTFQYLDFYNKALKYSFDKAFISQSAYIFHGIPLRVLYSTTETFSSAGLEALFKQIKIPNDTGSPYSQYYKKIFKEKFGEKEINEGYKALGMRFHGKDDLGWFNFFGNHPYESRNHKFEIEFDGVLFLHDFYDGAHFYGKTLFPDLYTWAKFTLELIVKFNLKIAVKEHPFQIQESKKICEKLREEFKTVYWLDDVSNKEIFSRGIDFGITQHGTVISELAYHNIKPIYCANHPIQYFDIGFRAKKLTNIK